MVERTGLWPPQLTHMLVALLGKPAGATAPSRCSPPLCRVWARARKADYQSWCEARVGHWDTAVKGCSALRAGLRRLMATEMAE
eukprot:12408677-Alexandrium_andersonii.AAC.1